MKLLLSITVLACLTLIFFILCYKFLKKIIIERQEEKKLINDLPKACRFLENKGIDPDPKKTKFVSVVLDGRRQASWLTKESNGKNFYTFGAKGENFQKHSKEPKWTDYCPHRIYVLYDKDYRVIGDTSIIKA